MAIKLISAAFQAVPLKTRIPFKFGITTMTAAPHLFVRAVVGVDGKKVEGISADFLPPKWFTKNPATSYEADRRGDADCHPLGGGTGPSNAASGECV